MKPYFAYGSNLRDAQMEARCPESRKIGLARLRGYRWIITTRGYANIVESGEDEVEGVLFEISQADEDSLDVHEGVPAGSYFKMNLFVLCGDEEVSAMVYIDPISSEGPPQNEYIRRINLGLADAKLSESYVTRYVRKFIPE